MRFSAALLGHTVGPGRCVAPQQQSFLIEVK
jgi:hypothetical protein